MRIRDEGPSVGVYAAEQAGFESDPETPWATVCEEHGSILCHTRLKDAMGLASHPREWCESCAKGEPSALD